MPLVPTFTVTAFGIVAPVDQFRFDTTGRVVPVGDTVRYPSLVVSVTVTFKTTAATPLVGTPELPPVTVTGRVSPEASFPPVVRVSSTRAGFKATKPPGSTLGTTARAIGARFPTHMTRQSASTAVHRRAPPAMRRWPNCRRPIVRTSTSISLMTSSWSHVVCGRQRPARGHAFPGLLVGARRRSPLRCGYGWRGVRSVHGCGRPGRWRVGGQGPSRHRCHG